jgi:hypothetical protein
MPLNKTHRTYLYDQLLSHLYADFLETLHSCYRHIQIVYVMYCKCLDIFSKFNMWLNFVVFPASFE